MRACCAGLGPRSSRACWHGHARGSPPRPPAEMQLPWPAANTRSTRRRRSRPRRGTKSRPPGLPLPPSSRSARSRRPRRRGACSVQRALISPHLRLPLGRIAAGKLSSTQKPPVMYGPGWGSCRLSFATGLFGPDSAVRPASRCGPRPGCCSTLRPAARTRTPPASALRPLPTSLRPPALRRGECSSAPRRWLKWRSVALALVSRPSCGLAGWPALATRIV